jgi:hypothetical protein
MKYLITESQIDNVIFKYLNLKRFIQVERGDNIYFVKSEDDKYAKIMYDKSGGWCGIHYKLIEEISRFFSLELTDSEQVIGRWVENTLQMRVTDTYFTAHLMRIIVENTLQMRNN